jgi:uncharacterized protein with ParB-like and HNH nuclease domain
MYTVIKQYKIYDILSSIYNNKFVLPSIQRQYIWSMQQIQALFDSIMLGYPISTFLFWNLKGFDLENNGFFYQFLKEVSFDSVGKPKNDMNKSPAIDSKLIPNDTIAILDGQQRLTSLYLTLFGKVKQFGKFSKVNGVTLINDLYLDLSSGISFFDDEEIVHVDEEDKIQKETTSYTFDFKFFSSIQKRDKWFRVKDIIDYKDKN